MPKPTPVYLDPSSAAYKSPDEAAHGLAGAFDPKLNAEQAAIIMRCSDGSHKYSTIAPQLEHDNFALSAQIPQGCAISGIVHTHLGDDHDGQMFSPHDVAVANQLKVPSYIHFVSSGSMRKYVPGQTATSNYGQWQQVAKGDPLQLAAGTASSDGPLSQAINSTSGG